MDIPVFVINLARDSERRLHMELVLRDAGLEAEFVEAVDGRALTDAQRAMCDVVKTLRIYGGSMRDNEIACYLSHFQLFERMVRENVPVALIFEDDLEIEPGFPVLVRSLVEGPFQDWVVVRLESLRSRVLRPQSPKFEGRRVAELANGAGLYRLRTHPLGAGGYLIKREGARRMVDYGRRIFMPIDHTMDRYWENGITPYIVRPLPLRQRPDLGSSIGLCGEKDAECQSLLGRFMVRIQRLSDSARKRLFWILD